MRAYATVRPDSVIVNGATQTEGRLKVVHIITGLGRGGAEGALFRLVAALRERHTMSVISLGDDGVYGQRLRALGIPVHALRLGPGRSPAIMLFRLFRLLRNERPDVVQTWLNHADLLGGIAARLAGRDALVWGLRHSRLDPATQSKSARWVASACTRLAPRLPTRIIACSADSAATHQAVGYPEGKLRVVGNGFDLDRLRPDFAAGQALRRTWRVADDTPLVGTVASFSQEKDHANLLAALAQLAPRIPDWRCVLVGRGLTSANAELVDAARAFGVYEHLILAGERADIPAVMNALDLHVLPSRTEGFPNVIGEAMACGTPCVATDVGDAARIIGDAGWTAPPRDPTALAASIEQALDAIGARGKAGLGAVCRRRIEQHFGMDTMLRAYETIWRDAIAHGATG
ncbi:MAG: glycosyltransferase family 4 protein [Thiotrichales bacterium]